MNKKKLQNMSDEQLLELAKNQDVNAIEQLLERYKYVASAVAHSYFLNGGDAEDLLQEGMIAVFNAINTFNGKASFKSYVYTCVKNKIITLIKKKILSFCKLFCFFIFISDYISYVIYLQPQSSLAKIATFFILLHKFSTNCT